MDERGTGTRQRKAEPGRTPNAVRAKASKEAVLKAARKLFVWKGFQRTTMDDIARAAKLSKGGIYFHFPDKLSILQELLDEFGAKIRPMLAAAVDESLDPQSRLVTYVHWISREAVADPEAMLLPIPISMEFLAEEGDVPEMVAKHYLTMTGALEKIFADGQAAGVFTGRSDAKHLASIIMALQDGILLEWLRRHDRMDGGALVRALRLFILEAVRSERHDDHAAPGTVS